jgi:hypothetical protein
VLAARQEGKGIPHFDAGRLEVSRKRAAVIRLEPLERPSPTTTASATSPDVYSTLRISSGPTR